MNKNDFKELVKERCLILDGAMGTELQKRGSLDGVGAPEELNLKYPERIAEIQKDYLEAGSDIIFANTFGANRHKLADYNLTDKLFEINQAGINNSKKLAKKYNAFVAGDIGPIGSYLEPLGATTFDSAYEIFAEQVKAINTAGPDLMFIETMAEIREVKAALLAVKDNFNGPVVVQMTFNTDGSTVTGTDILSFLSVAEAMGADAVGLNCSVGPKDLLKLAHTLTKYSKLPISFKPNAGMPKLINRQTVFPGTCNDFLKASLEAYKLGVNLFGGCCGTTPEFIKALASKLKGKEPKKRNPKDSFLVSSRVKALDLYKKPSLFIIGERINPTNRKKFQEELSNDNFTTIRKEAQEQVKSGADILDINMGVPGLDEVNLMKKAVSEIQEVVSVPLCLDSSNISALEAGLKECAGKPIINSINGDDENLKRILPLAKRYGAALVGLCTDKRGIPETAKQRLSIANKIRAYAKKYGFSQNEIIFDFLTLSVSATTKQSLETLNAIKKANKLWPKNKTVLGVSNISFGMPNRQVINSTFLKLAKASGLNMGILNPNENWRINDSSAKNLLLAKDSGTERYIKKHGSFKKAIEAVQTLDMPSDKKLYTAILEGNREEITGILQEVIDKGFSPLHIANLIILKALNDVGEKFNNKEYFLPQVIRCAEAAQLAFSKVKPMLIKDTSFVTNKIVLATVKGDVHDIGKNIVSVVFESHGWEVVDLGKNVEAKAIVETAKKLNSHLIGLSALMTTTMLEMENVIKLKNTLQLNSKVIIGGAPVTKKFAQDIGADAYAKDAVEAVEVAKNLL
ncbi:MAG: homocysteine S-methyltransferase family protein [Elusimicrobia bacterium]|nr:homocysteine S-methyltransferase family protein [Candidatus Liberimonas magnetica]